MWKTTFSKLALVEQRIYERLLATKMNEQLDVGYGSCVLRRDEIARIVATVLDCFHDQRVSTGDYVIMPNHVHVLLRPLLGFELEDILQSIKSFTANQINRLTGHEGTLWQRQSYDHVVRDSDQLAAFQRYIEANPKKAKLKPGEYLYSSATYFPDE